MPTATAVAKVATLPLRLEVGVPEVGVPALVLALVAGCASLQVRRWFDVTFSPSSRAWLRLLSFVIVIYATVEMEVFPQCTMGDVRYAAVFRCALCICLRFRLWLVVVVASGVVDAPVMH